MCNRLSGGYFVTAAQSIFANRLLQALASDATNIDATKVPATGASEIQRVFSGGDLAAVLNSYMVGIKDVFAFLSQVQHSLPYWPSRSLSRSCLLMTTKRQRRS